MQRHSSDNVSLEIFIVDFISSDDHHHHGSGHLSLSPTEERGGVTKGSELLRGRTYVCTGTGGDGGESAPTEPGSSVDDGRARCAGAPRCDRSRRFCCCCRSLFFLIQDARSRSPRRNSSSSSCLVSSHSRSRFVRMLPVASRTYLEASCR